MEDGTIVYDARIWSKSTQFKLARTQPANRFGPSSTNRRTEGKAWLPHSRGTKVEKMLTLAPERYTAGFCMAAKVILWCI